MERSEEWREIESGGDGTKMGWIKDVQNWRQRNKPDINVETTKMISGNREETKVITKRAGLGRGK